MSYFINAFKNCTDFKGRVTRKEYWMYILFLCIFGFLLTIGGLILFSFLPILSIILFIAYGFSVNIVSISMNVKRMNDIGKSPLLVVVGVFLPMATMMIRMADFYTSNIEIFENILNLDVYTMQTMLQPNFSGPFTVLIGFLAFAFRIYYFVLLCLPSVETSDVQAKSL